MGLINHSVLPISYCSRWDVNSSQFYNFSTRKGILKGKYNALGFICCIQFSLIWVLNLFDIDTEGVYDGTYYVVEYWFWFIMCVAYFLTNFALHAVHHFCNLMHRHRLSIKIKANKVAMAMHMKSTIETISFLLNLEVEINVSLRSIKINAFNN